MYTLEEGDGRACTLDIVAYNRHWGDGAREKKISISSDWVKEMCLNAWSRRCERYTRPSEVCHESQMTGKISEHIFTALKQTFGEINAVSGKKTKMGQIYPSGARGENGFSR